MTTLIKCSVLYHILKELNITIEYFGRYKTKTDLKTFFSIVIKNESHCESLEHIHLDGIKKWNKTYSFEVSIQTIYIKKFPQLTITGLVTT